MSDRRLFYSTRRQNLPLIVQERAVQSARSRPAAYLEMWDPAYAAARRTKVTGLPGGQCLDSFVSLALSTKTPAAYNLATGYCTQKIMNHDILYLSTTASRLEQHLVALVVVTAQPFSACARFIAGARGLAEVDDALIDSGNFASTTEDPGRKVRFAAEVLAHSSIPLDAFCEILCADDLAGVSYALGPIDEPEHPAPSVVCRPGAYFRQ